MYRWLGAEIAGPYGDEPWDSAMSAHSYSVCRNRMSESAAL